MNDEQIAALAVPELIDLIKRISEELELRIMQYVQDNEDKRRSET